jgi:uncharacterized protein YbjT (DUF2867 family)
MIVVAGGSGLLGRQVVADLVGRGPRVRVLVRDRERATAVLPEEVDVVAADVRERRGLDEIVYGADAVVSAVHGFLGGRGGGPREVDQHGNANLIDAAAAAGAAVVLVSVLEAAPDSPVELFRAKYRAEQHLLGSGAPWTIIRPGAYLETWLGILTKTAGTSGRPLIFGRGEEPIWFVSATDVAALVSRAATDSASSQAATLRGRVVEAAGEQFTMTELARSLQDARGWSKGPRHLPRTVLRTLAVATRLINPAFARQNSTALAMDTGRLTVTPSPGPTLEQPSRTLSDVLAGLAVPD